MGSLSVDSPRLGASALVVDRAKLTEALEGLAQTIIASTNLERQDRLWPADPMVYQTNPMSLAYGACGTALFLHDFLGSIPLSVRDWLLAQPIDTKSYPPGLYLGISGVAWCLAEMGLFERGVELLELAVDSPLAFACNSVLNGTAGWGLASLAFHRSSGSQKFLDFATRAGDSLVSTAEIGESGAFWRDSETGLIHLGLARGGCGSALFLLYLWRATGVESYLEVAREAVRHEVVHAQVRGEALRWGTHVGAAGHYPYWLRGGGGVAATLIRFYSMLGEDNYLLLARKAARGCNSFFSAAPHLFEGLAAIGDVMLDMFAATGEPEYLELARQKAMQTLLYRLDGPEGIAFPGRFLLRISHDYGVGGAGIGSFLLRVVDQRPRRFHDL